MLDMQGWFYLTCSSLSTARLPFIRFSFVEIDKLLYEQHNAANPLKFLLNVLHKRLKTSERIYVDPSINIQCS